MATSKTTKKPSSKTTTTSSRAASAKKAQAAPGSASVPPYGLPIREAIARGDVQEMRKLALSTKKWLTDVQAALGSLEKAIQKMGGK